jgi:hypothetical protein
MKGTFFGAAAMVLAAAVVLTLAPAALAGGAHGATVPASVPAPSAVSAGPAAPVVPAVPAARAVPAIPAVPTLPARVGVSISPPVVVAQTPLARVHATAKGHVAQRSARKSSTAARIVAATINCPLPGPMQAVHCTNVPTGGAIPDQCTNQMVVIDGNVQFTITAQVNTDGTMTIYQRENYQGVTGTSVLAQYSANDMDTSESFTSPLGSVAFAIDKDLELITVSPAQLPNELYRVHDDVAISVDPLSGLPTITDQLAAPYTKCSG